MTGKPSPGNSAYVGIEVGRRVLRLRGMVGSMQTCPRCGPCPKVQDGGGAAGGTGACFGVMRAGRKQKHLHLASQERMMPISPSMEGA